MNTTTSPCDRSYTLFRTQSSIAIPSRRRERFSAAGALNIALLHEMRNALVAREDTSFAKISLDARPAICLQRRIVERFDMIADCDIDFTMKRWRTFQPRVLAAGRDPQHTVLRDDWPKGLVRFHEFEDFDGIESVSRANQAVAFERMPRSISSCLMRLRQARVLFLHIRRCTIAATACVKISLLDPIPNGLPRELEFVGKFV